MLSTVKQLFITSPQFRQCHHRSVQSGRPKVLGAHYRDDTLCFGLQIHGAKPNFGIGEADRLPLYYLRKCKVEYCLHCIQPTNPKSVSYRRKKKEAKAISKAHLT